MPFSYIGPIIAIAVNLPLAIWALIKQARNPAYRAFALFAVSLVIWNLGSEVFHRGGPPTIWHGLSFFGMSLVPANFLCLALLARAPAQPGPRGGYWRALLYLPMAAMGLALNPAVIAQDASPSWLSGFYQVSAPSTLLFAAVTAIYLAAALWISWSAARRSAQGDDWQFYMVQLPFALGTLCVLAVAWIHSPTEKSPTVSLWAMVMSQYAMYMMIRHKLVSFELTLTRGVTLVFLAAVLAACVLLGLEVISVLFGNVFSHEMSLILVVCVVALCVLYAAVVPRLEEFFDAIFRQNRKQ